MKLTATIQMQKTLVSFMTSDTENTFRLLQIQIKKRSEFDIIFTANLHSYRWPMGRSNTCETTIILFSFSSEKCCFTRCSQFRMRYISWERTFLIIVSLETLTNIIRTLESLLDLEEFRLISNFAPRLNCDQYDHLINWSLLNERITNHIKK